MDLELAHDAGAVGIHCLQADIEGYGDIFVTFAFGEVLQNFPLARGELCERRRIVLQIGDVSILQLRKHARHSRTEEVFVLAYGFQGIQQFAGGIGLE